MRRLAMRILVLGVFVTLAPAVTGCEGEAPEPPSQESQADDANISYDSKTNLAFTNNRILLFSTPDANPSKVVQSLAKYGTVDASNSLSGMYAVTTDEHLDSVQLSELIDRIVGNEELIAGGSINWELPGQGDSTAEVPATAPTRA